MTRPKSFIDDLEVPSSEWWDELPAEIDCEADSEYIDAHCNINTVQETPDEERTRVSSPLSTTSLSPPRLDSIAADIRQASTPCAARNNDTPPTKFWTADDIWNQMSSPPRNHTVFLPFTPDAVNSSQQSTQIALSPSPCTDKLKSVIPETPHHIYQERKHSVVELSPESPTGPQTQVIIADSTSTNNSHDSVDTAYSTSMETIVVQYADELEFSQDIDHVTDSQGTSVRELPLAKRNLSKILESVGSISKRRLVESHSLGEHSFR